MSYEHTFIYKDATKTADLTPRTAIKEKCLECSCWAYAEVRNCPISDCALYPFRMGKAHSGKTPANGFKSHPRER